MKLLYYLCHSMVSLNLLPSHPSPLLPSSPSPTSSSSPSYLPQGAKYKAMEQLQQEKTASTEKHLSEQKALINNLSNLRTQLESSKAKVQSLETMVTKHTSTITGECTL